jgi:hypothetical protein
VCCLLVLNSVTSTPSLSRLCACAFEGDVIHHCSVADFKVSLQGKMYRAFRASVHVDKNGSESFTLFSARSLSISHTREKSLSCSLSQSLSVSLSFYLSFSLRFMLTLIFSVSLASSFFLSLNV